MTSAGDLRGEDQECSSDQEHGRKETPTGDSRRPQGRFAGTRAGGHLKMFQDLRPASGNLPEGRLSSSPAPGKSFEQKREATEVMRVTRTCPPLEKLSRKRPHGCNTHGFSF